MGFGAPPFLSGICKFVYSLAKFCEADACEGVPAPIGSADRPYSASRAKIARTVRFFARCLVSGTPARASLDPLRPLWGSSRCSSGNLTPTAQANFGDSRSRLSPLRGSAFGLGQPGGYAAGASRSGDMSDREAESNKGMLKSTLHLTSTTFYTFLRPLRQNPTSRPKVN